MIKKKIFGSNAHPVEFGIKKMICDKLVQHIHEVTKVIIFLKHVFNSAQMYTLYTYRVGKKVVFFLEKSAVI